MNTLFVNINYFYNIFLIIKFKNFNIIIFKKIGNNKIIDIKFDKKKC